MGALQTQVDLRFEILNHNMLVIAQKLGIHKDRLRFEPVAHTDEDDEGGGGVAALVGGRNADSSHVAGATKQKA